MFRFGCYVHFSFVLIPWLALCDADFGAVEEVRPCAAPCQLCDTPISPRRFRAVVLPLPGPERSVLAPVR